MNATLLSAILMELEGKKQYSDEQITALLELLRSGELTVEELFIPNFYNNIQKLLNKKEFDKNFNELLK